MAITIREEKLPDRFLIVPNREEFFGEFRNEENLFEVVETFKFRNVAEVDLFRLGAFGFRFLDDGPLRSVSRLRFQGQGEVPEDVLESEDAVIELQSQRMAFANFVSAAFFGRMASLRHMSLSGAQFAGMDKILSFARRGAEVQVENTRHTKDVIGPKVKYATNNPKHVRLTKASEIDAGISFLLHVAKRESELEVADLQSCMAANYQAAILHESQLAAASLAVNFSVAEALVDEIFHAYGLAGKGQPKAFATRSHSVKKISSNALGRMNLKSKLLALRDGALIDFYLHQRLDSARQLRNQLMHRAAPVHVRQASQLQTVVRDLWAYLLDEPFELLTGWRYRI